MKRWPIIRHVRALYLANKVYKFAAECQKIGLGIGGPNPADLEHLRAIWRGEA